MHPPTPHPSPHGHHRVAPVPSTLRETPKGTSRLTIPTTEDKVPFGSTKPKVHYSVLVDSAPFASWRYSQLYRLCEDLLEVRS